jgi:hypothetical protein
LALGLLGLAALMRTVELGKKFIDSLTPHKFFYNQYSYIILFNITRNEFGGENFFPLSSSLHLSMISA